MPCLVMQPLSASEFPGAQLSVEDINQELQRKRVALDDEIRRFTAEKNAEFATFEKELRSYLAGRSVLEARTGLTSNIVRNSSFDGLERALFTSTAHNKQSNRQSARLTPAITPTTNFAKQSIEIWPSSEGAVGQGFQNLELDAPLKSSYLPLTNSIFQEYRKPTPNDEDRISSSLDAQSQASVPERPAFPDRRLSWSPTGAGRSSHKSSLRRPASDNPHRERKRVLFSIDNQIMSPKASPENQRSSFGMNSMYANIASSMRPEAMISSASAEPWTQSIVLVSPTRTYKDLVEPTIITPPEELEQEELQFVTSDPLFGNDEPAPQFEDEDWVDGPADDRYSDSEEPTAISLHVGSVPIRIRQRNGT